MSADVSELERIADLRLRLHGLIDLPQLSHDELACTEMVIHGLVRGRDVYGPLRVADDERDMRAEASAELRDAMVYAAAGLLRLQRKG